VKILLINGSPRKTWNTATLLNKASEGALSQNAETEIINLYDLNFKGCTSCFSCKLKGGNSYGKCGYKDELSTILDKVENIDAMILGSPIYLGTVTGEMRSFLERLIFPYLKYDEFGSSLFPKKIPVGFIYTMGVDETNMKLLGIDTHINLNNMLLGKIFGSSESLVSMDTYQFDDYSKYESTRFIEADKAKRRKEVFPLDCNNAFNMGVKLAK
jgi:multimeric flavodoxin WrbA